MKVIPHALDPKICEEVCKFAQDQLTKVDPRKEPVRMWTNFGWPASIIQDSAPVLCFVTPDSLLDGIQSCLESHGIFDSNSDLPLINGSERSICLTYVWTYNSYIPRHKDGEFRKTVTIYCNPTWSYEKGGMFQWFHPETEQWESLVPSCGTLIFNDRDLIHATTPVKSQTEFRISLQIFILRKPV
jgi:hypothetical protein